MAIELPFPRGAQTNRNSVSQNCPTISFFFKLCVSSCETPYYCRSTRTVLLSWLCSVLEYSFLCRHFMGEEIQIALSWETPKRSTSTVDGLIKTIPNPRTRHFTCKKWNTPVYNRNYGIMSSSTSPRNDNFVIYALWSHSLLNISQPSESKCAKLVRSSGTKHLSPCLVCRISFLIFLLYLKSPVLNSLFEVLREWTNS